MSTVRRLARPLLSIAFISNGVHRVRKPEQSAASLAPLVGKVNDNVDFALDATTVARATGAAQIGAGLLLATGRLPRFSSSALVATLVIDTAGEKFWKVKDPTERKAGQQRFLTGLSLLGGALLASVDTDGKPGVAWRAQHAADSTKKYVGRGASRTAKAAGRTSKAARREAKRAKRGADRFAKQAVDAVTS
ncbi:DoxX family membrane protein [Saxibacter everestensis]|uniref:DoxX family membrane protein n=1 Tax=Saxibacter everestensis TaxID=2909229 RepID=A0ABY8QQI0_9MICO|nr:DoxX family membrane protein [Brevibacteriaceae bacterium ZFBP1038]